MTSSADRRRRPAGVWVARLAAIATLGLGGCQSFAEGGAASPAPALSMGAFSDAALLTDGTLVAAGHTGVDGSRNIAVVGFDDVGRPRWLAEEAIEPTVDARAEAVEVDAAGRVVVIGNVLAVDGSRGLVMAFGADGERLWETEPWLDGSAELYGLALAGGDAFVTGFARRTAADPDLPPEQGVLVARIDTASGVVVWKDVAQLTVDPLHMSAGLSVAFDGTGVVGVAGVVGFPDSSVAWFVAEWSADGAPRWEQLRDGGSRLGGGSLETGQIDVAREVAFDPSGDLYVVGDLSAPDARGTDLSLVKLAADGAERWTFRRDEVVPAGLPSFDEGHALAIGPDGPCVAGGLARALGEDVISEGIAASLSLDGAVRWVNALSSPSLAGEEVTDLAVDADGLVVYGGADSNDPAGERLVVEQVGRSGAAVWTSHLGDDEASATAGRVNRILIGGDGDVFAVGFDRERHDVPSEPLAVRLDRATGELSWVYPAGLGARLTTHRGGAALERP
ncbi:MAG: hypothetical protein IPK07_19430 [Deltaproteobacteria bacterium]|jgi:outer membrane protein assembly factor BamB|nr:hypothetical protein [Deltaproteobacteria bacterium]